MYQPSIPLLPFADPRPAPTPTPPPLPPPPDDYSRIPDRFRFDLDQIRNSSNQLPDHDNPPHSTPGLPPRTISGLRWILVILSILSSTFLFALDNTVVADIQPQIVLHFAAVDKLVWLSVSFIMAAVSTTLLFGQLYSHLWPKWLYIASVLVFEVGSAVCGATPGMTALIIGRALCGLGGSGIYHGVMSLIAATTTVQERPLYVGGIGLTWGLGTILGPLVGGAFAQSAATWRWAFYINLLIGIPLLPIYLLLLPSPDPHPDIPTLLPRLREIDFLGALLMLSAVTTFIIAINFGGTVYAWSSPRIITLFLASELFTLLFGLQQWLSFATTRSRRLLPFSILTGPNAQTTLIMFCTTAAGGAGIFVPVYFIPLFFQFTRGDDPVKAAVRLLPFILFGVVATLVQGALLSRKSGRFGFYMAWFLGGGVLAVAGGVMMFLVRSGSSDAWVYASSSLLGAGLGMFSQAGFSVAQASNEEAAASEVAAFIALGQTGGITLALAVANSVFINEATRRIGMVLGKSVTREQINAAVAGVGSDFFEKMPPEVRVRVLEAVVEAMRRVYILVIVVGSVVVVLSFWMKRERLFISAAAVGG